MFSKFFRKKRRVPDGFLFTLRELTFSKNEGVRILYESEYILPFINDVAEFFRKTAGENFITVSMFHKDTGPLELTIRRHEGKTPATILAEMRDEIARLTAEKNDLIGRLDRLETKG